MASITVELPPLVNHPEEFLEKMLDAAIPGLDAELATIVTEIQTSEAMPVDRGQLRRAVKAEQAERQGEALVAAIVAAGQAAGYAAVQDDGRRAGAKNPPPGVIQAWVRRQMRTEVDELAAELQATYVRAHPRRRKGVSRSRARFRDDAVFLIARGVVRKLKRQGMQGKGFIADRVDEIASRAVRAVEDEFDIFIDRHNAGSAA